MSKIFDNTKIAFSLKNNNELNRAYFLFKMIANPTLVKIGTSLTHFALALHLPVKGLIRATVFDHFWPPLLTRPKPDFDLQNPTLTPVHGDLRRRRGGWKWAQRTEIPSQLLKQTIGTKFWVLYALEKKVENSAFPRLFFSYRWGSKNPVLGATGSWKYQIPIEF